MDYIGKKCPVCQKYFHADDDVVVCPDCGTPHHRECYESLGHCSNENLHEQGYDYQEDKENTAETDGMKICPSCNFLSGSIVRRKSMQNHRCTEVNQIEPY